MGEAKGKPNDMASDRMANALTLELKTLLTEAILDAMGETGKGVGSVGSEEAKGGIHEREPCKSILLESAVYRLAI